MAGLFVCSDRAGAVILFDRGGNAHILIAVLGKQCGGATVLLHHSIDQLSWYLTLAEVKFVALNRRCSCQSQPSGLPSNF